MTTRKTCLPFESDNLADYRAYKRFAKLYASNFVDEQDRHAQARAYCTVLIKKYWLNISALYNAILPLKRPLENVDVLLLTPEASELADSTARVIAKYPVEDAAYLIGSIYTTMLPANVRSHSGSYYTPPPLAERLIDLSESSGFDIRRDVVIDPACGSGVFLCSLAFRMWKANIACTPKAIMNDLCQRIRGIEIDPFAAWMAHVMIESTILELCITSNCRLSDDVIQNDNALTRSNCKKYDLVIGNPPYGRIVLSREMRSRYRESLFGHANLYGLFTGLALTLLKPEGILSYITPTSALGGKYFSSLRKLLITHFQPRQFGFISNRSGVFDDVLQETMLATYKCSKSIAPTIISEIILENLDGFRAVNVGAITQKYSSLPWFLPRGQADIELIASIQQMKNRFSDIGYHISTGPLVWNRFKHSLRNKKALGHYPIIWAESIVSDEFHFNAAKRGHVPFIEITAKDSHLIVLESCVLLQRTTSKEQERRLNAAVMPQFFLDEHNGAVVENHLNMIRPKKSTIVNPETISTLLNTKIVDRVFRCISGSVAVSAYELNALPIPKEEQMLELQKIISQGAEQTIIERCTANYYGVSK